MNPQILLVPNEAAYHQALCPKIGRQATRTPCHWGTDRLAGGDGTFPFYLPAEEGGVEPLSLTRPPAFETGVAPPPRHLPTEVGGPAPHALSRTHSFPTRPGSDASPTSNGGQTCRTPCFRTCRFQGGGSPGLLYPPTEPTGIEPAIRRRQRRVQPLDLGSKKTVGRGEVESP